MGICLGAMIAAGLALVSCDKVTPEEAPVISVSTASLSVPSSGGSYSFTYTVDNPADDGSVTCSGSVTWLSGFSVASGNVTFSAAENIYEDDRTGTVTVSYYYTDSYGRTDCAVATVRVVQAGTEYPSLEIDTAEVNADADGEVCSFGYTLKNAYSTSGLNCISNVDWISGFDYSTFGTISFTVAANGGSVARTGTITVTYDWDYGSVSGEVIVFQNYSVDEVAGLVGRYLASGYAIDDSTDAPAEATWYMTIYEYVYENDTYALIDGLTPVAEGYYPDSENFVALGYVENGALVIPTQLTGGVSSYGYVGWTPCLGYGSTDSGGYNWFYDYNWPSCTFTYSEEDGTWTSDYGEFLALFTLDDNYNITKFNGSFDVTYPGVVINKVSDTTSLAAPSSYIDSLALQAAFRSSGMTFHPVDEGLRLHTAGTSVR